MAARYLLELSPASRAGVPENVLAPFLDWGPRETDPARLRKDPASLRAVFFSGGADISPALYGERPGSLTQATEPDRDEHERQAFLLARAQNLPLIGICRGAQFLCAMAGGRLVQHLDGHALGRGPTHPIRARDTDGRLIDLECSSTHHQMQLPPPDSEILAWAEPRRAAGRYLDGDDRLLTPEWEIEAVYYPAIRAVGVQWHPEYLDPDHPCVAYTRRIFAARLGL